VACAIANETPKNISHQARSVQDPRG
jgi:hypothetical protein